MFHETFVSVLSACTLCLGPLCKMFLFFPPVGHSKKSSKLLSGRGNTIRYIHTETEIATADSPLRAGSTGEEKSSRPLTHSAGKREERA